MRLFVFIVIATLIYTVSSACLRCEFRMTAREYRKELHTFPLFFALTVFYFALVFLFSLIMAEKTVDDIG